MANSTSHIDSIQTSQASKEVTANAYFDAASPATLYGRRQSATSGLTWGYYGGNVLIAGAVTQIANGTLSLTASTTNYVEANPSDGSVGKNTTGFTAGRIPLYTVVTGTATVTSYTDHRLPQITGGRLAKSISDANTTLTQAESRAEIIEIAGSLTATRDIVLPLLAQQWIVFNGTSGGQSLRFIGATGTGITVANGKRAILYADGTNIVRASADA